MATFIKKGGKVVAQVCVQGRRAAKSFDNKAEAKDWAREKEHELKRSKNVMLGKSLNEALQRYADEVTPKKKGARWESFRIAKLQKDDLAAIQLMDLTNEDIARWVKLRQADGLLGSSINRELGLLSAVLTHARDHWNWLEGNPMKNVKKLKEPPHRDRIITKDETNKILASLGYEESKPAVTQRQRIGVAFLFALETAMRYGEIWKMDWKDIDWKKRFARLYDTKNGTDRDVPLSQRAIQLLQKLDVGTQGNVMKTNTKSSEVLWRRAVELAGYKGQIHFHDARHTATTHLAGKLDMLTLAKMTGHKDPRHLMIYFNPTPESIADRLG